ncbi:MAG: hypothetical protein AAGB93_17690, partial [Planctomycetota bacterium]
MTDPRDRLVEHALREVLGTSSEAGADLSRRVREAWERGERRPAPRLVRRSRREEAIDAALLQPPSRRASSPRAGRGGGQAFRRLRPGRQVAAAAAVFVAGGVVALLANREAGPNVGPAPTPHG